MSPVDIIKELMKNGVMASINQVIDFDTAAIVATDFGFDAAEERHRGRGRGAVERARARVPAEDEVDEEEDPAT